MNHVHAERGHWLRKVMDVLGQPLRAATEALRRGSAQVERFYERQVEAQAAELEAWAGNPAWSPSVSIQELPVEHMSPRESVLMLYHLDNVGVLYTDRPTCDAVSAQVRKRLWAVECRPAHSEAPRGL